MAATSDAVVRLVPARPCRLRGGGGTTITAIDRDAGRRGAPRHGHGRLRVRLDDFRLDDRVAVVTGAGRGIGAGIAAAYAAAGADLVLVARTHEQLDAVAEQIRATGRKALTVACDVRNLSEIPLVVERTIAEMGRLDIVVNNAGGASPTPFLDTSAAALEEAFRFNVTAAFELVKRAAPHLLESGYASVINITSAMDRMAGRGLVVYGTVKAALAHMTRLLAADLAPRVRVNAIAPGVVETDALTSALSEPARARAIAATPLRRLASVDDVAAAAVWLASPAASYVTGKVTDLDGGAQAPTLLPDIPDL
jgi:7-alpha-hydroxysteroid dehydrogenase